MRTLFTLIAALAFAALSVPADETVKPSAVSTSDTVTKTPTTDEEANELPKNEVGADKTEAKPAPLDTFNMPRRIRAQISYTTKRMLEFDKNKDGLLSQDELPTRMRGVIAKGDLDADSLLSKDELTRMAYDQIQKRDAKAEAEPVEKR